MVRQPVRTAPPREQWHAVPEDDGVHLELDLVDLVDQLPGEVSPTAEPDVPPRERSQIPHDRTDVARDGGHGRVGRQFAVGGDVLPEMRVGAGQPGLQGGFMGSGAHDHRVESLRLPVHSQRVPEMSWTGLGVSVEQRRERPSINGEGADAALAIGDEAVDRGRDVVDERTHDDPDQYRCRDSRDYYTRPG